MPPGPKLISVHEDGLALGDPHADPIVLTSAGITEGGGARAMCWSEVRALDLRSPSAGPVARVWSWTWQLLATAVLTHVPDPARLELRVTTPTNLHHVTAPCHTRAGYRTDELARARSLLDLLMREPRQRRLLDTPELLVSDQ